nr:histone-lysine N-methyltransferase, H3 lysine-9 specific SUVH4 [Tanacetum cinerariifolium]
NCMEQSIPVRFIRGIPGDKRFHGDTRFKLYTYDGLYTVDSYQLDVGKSGFAVYKFRLKRLGGQPKLTSNKVWYNKYNSRRMRISSVPKLESIPSEPEFCIEAGSVGNVARFINHSCDPNLFVLCVVSSHHGLRLACIILVASDNIPPNQELTYDYGFALDSVVDKNGNVQRHATVGHHCCCRQEWQRAEADMPLWDIIVSREIVLAGRE